MQWVWDSYTRTAWLKIIKRVNNIENYAFIISKNFISSSYPRFRFTMSTSTACSFAVHNLTWFIYFPLFKFHFIWHTNQTTEFCKRIFLNKSTYNFLFFRLSATSWWNTIMNWISSTSLSGLQRHHWSSGWLTEWVDGTQ